MENETLETAKADLFEYAANLVCLSMRYTDRPDHQAALQSAIDVLQEMAPREICADLMLN